GAGPDRIAHGRHAEEHDAADARLGGLGRGSAQRVERVLVLARHRSDGLRLVDALAHEERQHELLRQYVRLGHEAADGARLAQPARAGGGKAHDVFFSSFVTGSDSWSVSGISRASVVGGGTGVPERASISESTVRSGATTWIGRPTLRASFAVRGPIAAMTVCTGNSRNCSGTHVATAPIVTSIALMP